MKITNDVLFLKTTFFTNSSFAEEHDFHSQDNEVKINVVILIETSYGLS